MLRPRHLAAALGVVLAIPGTALFADSGIYKAFVIVNPNSSGNDYWKLGDTSNSIPVTSFNGLNLGTYDPFKGDTLVLNGGEIDTFKNNTDNITNTDLFYSIYPHGNSPNPFTDINIFYNHDIGFDGFGSLDQEWTTTAQNVNALAGLTPGKYDLAVYDTASFTYTDFGGGSGTHYDSNDSQNYVANFTVVPEPASLAVLGFGSLGLLIRRKSRK
jgi:hypothetical protein